METNIKSKIEYNLRQATKEDIDLLIKYKLSTILEYAKELSKNELAKIKNYVNDNVPKEINDYKIIVVNNKIVGAILVSNYEDGILLDEIYLKENYRNLGIGSNLIKRVLDNNKIVYLWVYKDNIKALNLYKRLGFHILEETETRYKMVYNVN